jgi:hypothetical protein
LDLGKKIVELTGSIPEEKIASVNEAEPLDNEISLRLDRIAQCISRRIFIKGMHWTVLAEQTFLTKIGRRCSLSSTVTISSSTRF